MPLVRRQSPEQIESRTRRNIHRAAIGIAACIGTLFGISAAATAVGAHKVEQGQERLEDYLLPNRDDHRTAVYQHVSMDQPGVDASKWPPTVLQIRDEPQPAPKRNMEWVVPLGAIGGAGAVSMGALVLLGAANRRRQEDVSDEIDIETTPEYDLYDFELRQIIDEQRMQDGMDDLETDLKQLEARMDQLDQDATISLLAARLDSNLNVSHMNTLDDMGRNPLEALNYSTPNTFYSLLDQGEPVGVACQPLVPVSH